MTKKYKPSELTLINVFSRDESNDWANDLCDAVRELIPEVVFAPDYNGTTTGDNTGINILILKSDLEFWFDVCDANSLEVHQSILEITAGHYGDGGWSGVDLVEDPEGNLEWRE